MKQHYKIVSNDCEQILHYLVWEPDTHPRGVLQITHGMQEYVERYEAFAEAMMCRGWVVIGHDHLGHGQSGKWERGFFTECSDGARVLIDDIRTINRIAHERWPELKVVLFGHSMGSFFTRRYLAEYGHTIDAVIICGSGWYNWLETGTAYCAAKLFSALKGPHSTSKHLAMICALPYLFSYRNEGKGAWLSRNKDNIERYKADPLLGFHFTCGGYMHMYENLMLVSKRRHYDNLCPVPMLVISGSDDPVGGTKGVKKIAAEYRSLGFANVTERIVAHDRHEILFEEDANETMSFIGEWLDKLV